MGGEFGLAGHGIDGVGHGGERTVTQSGNSGFPAAGELTIGFAHAAYQMAATFAARKTGIRHFEVRDLDSLRERMPEIDVLVISGLWRNELLERAAKLRWIQSI